MLDTIAAVVCITLTALAWARFRERQVVAAAYHAAAFMALSAAYAIAVTVSLQASTSLAGLAVPEDVQVLVFAVARLGAAILFVIAGVFTGRPTYGRGPAWILVAPALAVIVAAILGRWFDPPPDALRIISSDEATGLPRIEPFGAVIALGTAILFFAGAYVSRGLWRTGHAVIDGWIAVGLVFAGFAELHWVLYPSAHPGQVSTADLLRLVCSACLLAGLVAAFRAGQRELRTANVELSRAARRGGRAGGDGGAHAAGARTPRRARAGPLAGEAQRGESPRDGDLPVAARRAAEGAVAAIDVGLGDARDAVAALRSSRTATRASAT